MSIFKKHLTKNSLYLKYQISEFFIIFLAFILLIIFPGCKKSPLGLGASVEWVRTFGGSEYDIGMSVVQTVDDGYIVGSTYSFGAGDCDVYLIKTQ